MAAVKEAPRLSSQEERFAAAIARLDEILKRVERGGSWLERSGRRQQTRPYHGERKKLLDRWSKSGRAKDPAAERARIVRDAEDLARSAADVLRDGKGVSTIREEVQGGPARRPDTPRPREPEPEPEPRRREPPPPRRARVPARRSEPAPRYRDEAPATVPATVPAGLDSILKRYWWAFAAAGVGAVVLIAASSDG
jgi:hypothetical protein